MAKQLRPGWIAKSALNEARLGNPGHLIARLSNALQTSNQPLTDAEYWFVIEALEATGGKRHADELRKIEQYLIASQVEGFMTENGITKKQAVDSVMRHRGRSRRHVYTALKLHNKVKGRSG